MAGLRGLRATVVVHVVPGVPPGSPRPAPALAATDDSHLTRRATGEVHGRPPDADASATAPHQEEDRS